MKKLIFIVVIILASTTSLAEESTLTLEVSGLQKTGGSVFVGLYSSKENYQSGKAIRRQTIPVTGSTMIINFAQIPFGDYGIKLFHDKNDDKKMNFNFFGIPTELYGYSNNANGFMSGASWKQAKFKIDKKVQKHEIRVRKAM